MTEERRQEIEDDILNQMVETCSICGTGFFYVSEPQFCNRCRNEQGIAMANPWDVINKAIEKENGDGVH